MGIDMAQASVLNESEIRRVLRIIETTRHAERNRLAFVLSFFAGMRVGEISALTVCDVVTRVAMFDAKSNWARIRRRDRRVVR
jgi:integrase